MLCAFGIRQVGSKAAKVLAMTFGSLDALMAATEEELRRAGYWRPRRRASATGSPIRQSQDLIARLRAAGVNFASQKQVTDTRFAGKTFVLTGH